MGLQPLNRGKKGIWGLPVALEARMVVSATTGPSFLGMAEADGKLASVVSSSDMLEMKAMPL